MDFKKGGHWLYAMIGLEGEEHRARLDYTAWKSFKIVPLRGQKLQ